MAPYLLPIRAAAMMFPLLAAALTLPYMLWQYYKRGAVSWWRSVVIFSFLFYLQAAYYLVLLPLPDPASVAHLHGPFVQLKPFWFVHEFLAHSTFSLRDPSTYLSSLKTGLVLQPLFNLLLTVPFGVYLRFYFKRRLWQTALMSFLLSLSFELLQLSGLLGLYDKPYRLFDVDDLMINTLGGLLGFALAALIPRFVDDRDEMDRHDAEKSRRVSYTRRLFALLWDCIVVFALDVALLSLAGHVGLRLPSWTLLCVTLVYFVLLPQLTGGRTLGKALVHIKLSADEHARFGRLRLLMRQLLVVLQLPLLSAWWVLSQYRLAVLLVQAALLALAALGMLLNRNKGKRLWHGRLTRVGSVSTLRVAADN